jgi:hypothetical protein
MCFWGYWDWNEGLKAIKDNRRLIEREREEKKKRKKNPKQGGGDLDVKMARSVYFPPRSPRSPRGGKFLLPR